MKINTARPVAGVPSRRPAEGITETSGYLCLDIQQLPRMTDEDTPSYLCVAIDRAGGWAYCELLPDNTVLEIKGFLERLVAAYPIRIETILTDNGPVRWTCHELGLAHCLVQPRQPQFNVTVERFHRRIAALANSAGYRTAAELLAAIGPCLGIDQAADDAVLPRPRPHQEITR